MPINAKTKTPTPAPETVQENRVRFKAYVAKSSQDYIETWQNLVRESPQQPSNGRIIDQLVSFAVLRGFQPKPKNK